MKLVSHLHLPALALGLLAMSAFAVDPPEKPPASATPAAPSTAPATSAAPVAPPVPDPSTVYSATDLDALRPVIGQTVTVTGTIVVQGESKSKTVRYLNFTKNFKVSCGLVFFASKGGEEFTPEKLAPWVGKKVSATGKLSEFNGSLQVEIEKWEQLKEMP